jgi:uncharacterized membrane protein
MAAASDLRIGDADREAAAAALREHFAHGRLTLEEFQHRLELVFAAKTDRDLAAITRDLPHVAPPLAWPDGRSRRRSSGHGGSGQAGSGHGTPGHGTGGPRRRSSLAGIAGLVVIILALILIAFILPVAFIGTVISRSLLFVLLALLFGRRGLLRRFRRWLPRSVRRKL